MDPAVKQNCVFNEGMNDKSTIRIHIQIQIET